MQALDQTGSIAESAFRLFRFFLQALIFLAAIAVSWWGIRTFLLNGGGRSSRWRNTYSGISIVVLIVLSLLRGAADKVLAGVGDAISRLRPESELGWLSGMMVGIYYALIATSFLLLSIYVVGQVYWFADKRIGEW